MNRVDGMDPKSGSQHTIKRCRTAATLDMT
jgi:hypothetical protein